MINKLLINAQCRAYKLQEAMVEKMTEKRNGDSQLVVALVLVAVAIGLCIVFRNQIKTTMTDLFTKISTAITNLTSDAVKS